MRLTLVMGFGAWLVSADARAEEEPGPCTGRGTSLVVRTGERGLYLCEEGKSLKRYPVSLGRKGTGKEEQGDLKTPVGTYTLGVPRRSTKFGMFIPVGYPTAEQAKKGYSGGAIGVHGPVRGFTWAGALNTWVDWTRGCIAVATDEDIRKVSLWVEERKPKLIHILKGE